MSMVEEYKQNKIHRREEETYATCGFKGLTPRGRDLTEGLNSLLASQDIALLF
jgi:hypothetical protein